MQKHAQEMTKELELKTAIDNIDDFFLKSKQKELYKFIIETVEKPLIERTLERTYGNQIKAAKLLGINRNTLRDKIKRLKIDVNKWKL